jgi:hypothetical protein
MPKYLPLQNTPKSLTPNNIQVLSDEPEYSSTTDVEIQVDTMSLEDVVKLKREIKMLKFKVKRLNEKVETKNRNLQALQKQVDAQTVNEQLLQNIVEDAKKNEMKAIFLLDQINNYNKQKPKWSEITVRACISWRISSPKGYNYCNNLLLKLPSRRTLQRYLGTEQEISDLIRTRLEAEANSLRPIERISSLIIDDMAIKSKMYYSRTEDTFYGLQTVDSSKPIGQKPILANQLLCYVVHGLSTKFTIPAAYFFHKQLSASNFLRLTLTVLQTLHNCGFIVIRIVTDNHKSNVALFKHLAGNTLMSRIPHPVKSEIPLFLSFDYCHIIKNLRNIFLDHNMHAQDGIISSKYLKKLYDLQKNLIVKPVKFLTKKHLYPTNFEKMNVRRAVEIFSPQVTAALSYLEKYKNPDFLGSQPTIKFMEFMYTFFKIHDVSDKTQYFRKQEPISAPYVNINDERLIWLVETLPSYVNTLQELSKQSNMKGLTKETHEALIFTAKSTAQCIKYLLEESGFYFVLTRSFSSDAIESMFSSVRLQGGSQDATDARAAHYAIKRIIQSGLITSSPSANILADCSTVARTGALRCDTNSLNIDVNLPDYIMEEILEIQNIENCKLYSGIHSSSMAFLAGYIALTIEERVECEICLNTLLTVANSNPLLDLINLQNRGNLKYPTNKFAAFINKIVEISLKIVPHLPTKCKPIKILTSILNRPIVSSNFFTCAHTEHRFAITEIILSKLLRPVLSNVGSTRTDLAVNAGPTNSISCKPISRKILKL